jgi:hypothetical protein
MKEEPQPVIKSPPVTSSERYLEALSAKSFLSLWSYPRIFRDQHNGKEVCDLLVIFESDIVIFSDKHCTFKNTSRPCVDWERWFTKTIHESARQLWGAERWIIGFPNRLFLDSACQKPFPLAIPKDARFYRVAVAHGVEAYAKAAGRSGLTIEPTITGKAHYGENCQPFKVGRLDPVKGFVHVLDRTALTALLETLDTIQDFISYLRDKEEFIHSGKLRRAASEQDLLAVYLDNPNSEYSFKIPSRYKVARVSDGNWTKFQRSARRLEQKKSNRISYYWDELIESYNKNILEGRLHPDTSSHGITENERVLRILAHEPRTKRRELSRSLIEFITKGKSGFRVIFSTDSRVAYVFGATPTDRLLSADDRAGVRKIDLAHYCVALRSRYPALDIVGIAVEAKNLDPESMILIHIDTRNWGTEQEEYARTIQEQYGFATNLNWRGSYVTNFPDAPRPPKNLRNKPCPCGSGVKYKKCCGAAR